MSQSASRFGVSPLVVFSNVILDITISCCSFVFSQPRIKVSAGLSDVNGLAVVSFVYGSLPVLRSVLVLAIRKQSP